jgi:mono/diheme cytochrome c family protein
VRTISTILALALFMWALAGEPRAQSVTQDTAQVQRGREIADKVCWICHVTGRDQEYSPILKEPGPDFRAIAEKSDTTSASLTAFLHTAHRTEDKTYTMPNPGLSDEMISAVVGYIMSLKHHP